MRLVVLSKIYCTIEDCEHSFELELAARPAPLNTANVLTVEFPRDEIPAPAGWYIDGHHVLCPRHNVDGEGKSPAPDAVLEKARRLQALAMDKAAADNERRIAWAEFGKIWRRYHLPPELGLEGYEDD